jgi:hypothetical protein
MADDPDLDVQEEFVWLVRLYKERLAVYQAIIEHNEGRETATLRIAPWNLGARMPAACLEFWSGFAENPPPGRAQTKRTGAALASTRADCPDPMEALR